LSQTFLLVKLKLRFELILMTSNENIKSHFISSIASKWVSSFSKHTWFWLTFNGNCLGGKSAINGRWSWNSTGYYIDSNRSKWRWWRIRTILTIIGPIRNSVKTERPLNQWTDPIFDPLKLPMKQSSQEMALLKIQDQFLLILKTQRKMIRIALLWT